METQGQLYGRYRLLEVIGAGGMAEVFLAKMEGIEGFERRLAIKRILPHFSSNQNFIRMFIDEARLVGHFTHPNIVQTYDFGKIGDSYYISMEYVEGINVADIMTRYKAEKKTIPLEIILEVGIQACRGIDYAHRETDEDGRPLGIIHRDLTPHNILVSRKGVVKITDFGIAKASMNTHLTQAGMIKGKVPYMSPEQATGIPLTHVSDIFSLGIVLYEMCTLRRLFDGENDLTILKKVQDAVIPPIRDQNPKIPEELDRVIMKALARDRDERYQWAGEMEAELTKLKFSMAEIFKKLNLADFVGEFITARNARKQRAQAAAEKRKADAVGSFPVGATGSDVANGISVNPAQAIERATVMLMLGPDGLPITSPTPHLPYPETNSDPAMAPGEVTPSLVPSRSGAYPDTIPVPRSEMPTPPPMHLPNFSAPAMPSVAASAAISANFPAGAAPSQVHTGVPVAPVTVSSKKRWIRLAVFGGTAVAACLSLMTVVLQPAKGSIELEVIPPDAQVLVNGRIVGANSPITLSDIPANSNVELEVRKPGFKPHAQTVNIAPNEVERLKVLLVQTTEHGFLSIDSRPAGAKVLLRGQPTGFVTPCRLSLPPSESYELSFVGKGYPPVEGNYAISGGLEVNLNVDLKAGTITASEPKPVEYKGASEKSGGPPTDTKDMLKSLVKSNEGDKG